jgi:hypothetical protein
MTFINNVPRVDIDILGPLALGHTKFVEQLPDTLAAQANGGADFLEGHLLWKRGLSFEPTL